MQEVTGSARRRGVRLSVFNHKGGVGKTTLTMNLAATLARQGSRVLVVDSDPQCNLTSYLLDDAVVDQLLDKADSPEGQTIWSGVQPVAEAIGGFKAIAPLPTSVESLFLIPGDIRLSEYETDLADFWAQCFQRKTKGFRGTTAISELVTSAAEALLIDYVFYDSGPSIGPLNRAVMLDCDYFIVPVACDLFSLRALKTLGRSLATWITDWTTIADLAPAGTYLLPGKPRFAGYVPTGFRVYAGAVASQHSHFLSRIDKEMYSQIVALLRKVSPDLAQGTMSQFKLGEIKNFGGLAPASQRNGLPIYEADAGTPAQRAAAKASFETVTGRLKARIVALS